MKINRNNYEEFFIDYFEGSLKPDKVKELFVFINANADIKEEFDSFENFSIVADENIVFDSKEKLKKKDIIPFGSMDLSNYEHFFIAEIENDLSEKESKEFKRFLELNPHLSETYHLLKLSKLKPDTSIVFKNKEILKKKEIISIGLIDQTNYETFFIAYHEKDLTPEEIECLDKFISQNNHLREEFNLFENTKLSPDVSFVFNNKNGLKKFVIINKSKEFKYYSKYISIAASILILFSIYFIYKPLKNNIYTAQTNPIYRENINANSFKCPTNSNLYSNGLQISNNNKAIINFSKGENILIQSLKPNEIKQIPINNQGDLEIISYRSKNNPITFDNAFLADNSLNNSTSSPITIKEFLIKKLRKNIIQSGEEFDQPADKLTGWDIAQVGVKGINKLTNSDIQLKRNNDNSNNSFALISNNFSILRNYKEK